MTPARPSGCSYGSPLGDWWPGPGPALLGWFVGFGASRLPFHRLDCLVLVEPGSNEVPGVPGVPDLHVAPTPETTVVIYGRHPQVGRRPDLCLLLLLRHPAYLDDQVQG